MTDTATEEPKPVKRKRTVKKKAVAAKAPLKPVIAAITTLGVFVVDLFLNVRYGIKLF